MTRLKRFLPIAFFSAGLLTGSLLQQLVPEAQAGTVNWQETVQDPAFRAAVIDVINACIVDNGIIFCN